MIDDDSKNYQTYFFQKDESATRRLSANIFYVHNGDGGGHGQRNEETEEIAPYNPRACKWVGVK